MNREKPVWARRLFWLSTAFEVVACVVVFTNANDAFGFVALMLSIGFAAVVVMGLLSLARPRYLPAVISLCLHASVLLAIFGRLYVYDPWASKLRYRAGRRIEAEKQQQEVWRTEVERLALDGKLGAAKDFVRKHEELRFDYGKPLTAVLCPADEKAPDLELLRLMGERGAPTGGDLLVEAAKCSLRSVKAVMSMGIAATAVSREGRTALTKARDRDLLEFLLRQGVKVDARDVYGSTALMYHRSAEVTRFLLAHGADAKAKNRKGRTALHYDGPEGELAAIYLALLEAGADPNARAESGSTPLYAMAGQGRWDREAAEVLVRHGGDPFGRGGTLSALRALVSDNFFPPEALKWPGLDLAGRDGAGLLIEALRAGKDGMVQELLDLGANPLAREEYSGDTAMDVARRKAMGDDHPTVRAMRRAAERFQPVGDADGGEASVDSGS